ncbi:MAG TPA: hypothetical protein PLL33_14460 [Paracoccus sp. (in: a-proteobacteria)]|nr:hypothetical protein [Paracoccus sp. (in: a-proteobacteria)]
MLRDVGNCDTGLALLGARLALNNTNLTDHQNYASAFGNSRAVPEAGRVFTLSLSKRF